MQKGLYIGIVKATRVIGAVDGIDVIKIRVVDVGTSTTATRAHDARVGLEPGIAIVAPLMIVTTA